ncbi:amino acid ABC transporter ATP-binding protein [TM7 phylum sp. oral taxon 351]|jgi:glutamine transport protein glnQ|nr:amino acid ABC transporter ATP-binding protein [TM7 phylum sp. oral taxon 351]
MSIVVKKLEKSFENQKVLRGIDLEIQDGETVVLIGSSGSGKSTFLRCLNLLNVPDKGQIFIDGQEITNPKTNLNKLRAKVGMVFQSFNLFENLNIIENIKLAPRKVLHLSNKQAEKEAIELLKRVGLGNKAYDYPKNLSGGQKQRVAIARALAMHPEVILFDEPTSALDPEMVGEVLEVIKNLAKDHSRTMVIVTHEMSFAREVGTRLIFLDKGKIIEDGEPHQVMNHPTTERAARFFQNIKN